MPSQTSSRIQPRRNNREMLAISIHPCTRPSNDGCQLCMNGIPHCLPTQPQLSSVFCSPTKTVDGSTACKRPVWPNTSPRFSQYRATQTVEANGYEPGKKRTREDASATKSSLSCPPQLIRKGQPQAFPSNKSTRSSQNSRPSAHSQTPPYAPHSLELRRGGLGRQSSLHSSPPSRLPRVLS